MSKLSYNRVIFLTMIWALIFFVMGCKLFYLQVVRYSYYRANSKKWQEKYVLVPAERGTIFDRKGRLLAYDMPFDLYAVIPDQINDPNKADSIIAFHIGKKRGFLLELLRTRTTYTYLDTVSKELSTKMWHSIVQNRINGIERQEVYRRFYPYRELAAHILGFVGNEIEGIEAKFDTLLKGTPGLALLQADCIRRLTIRPPKPGYDIYLTIDIDVQMALERELKAAVESSGGKAGLGVVMVPNSGEILALASYPTFDPNNFAKYPAENRRNRVLTDPFEPGSIFKVVPLAMLFENSIVKEKDSIFCHNGKYVDVKRNLRIGDVHPYGWLTVEDVIVKSSNIGTMLLSLLAPRESLYAIVKRFGFGTKTGIELPSEDPGNVPVLSNWSYATRLNVPFGQGIMVSLLQIVSAYSAIANDGVRIRPYIVKRIVDPSQKKEILSDRKELLHSDKERFLRLYGTRVISAETARRIKSILREVVKRGTGKLAEIEGLNIGGKTGTAQKAVGGRYTDKSFASFVGMAPIDNPDVIVAIVVDEPYKAYQFGGVAAAPYVGRLMAKINAISPDYLRGGSIEKENLAQSDSIVLPSLVMFSKAQAEKFLNWLGLEPVFIGNGELVLSHIPEGKSVVAKNSKVYLTLGEHKPEMAKSQIRSLPDLRGLPLKKAVMLLWSLDIPFKVVGSGVVKFQDPLPGQPISENTPCILHCSIN